MNIIVERKLTYNLKFFHEKYEINERLYRELIAKTNNKNYDVCCKIVKQTLQECKNEINKVSYFKGKIDFEI